MSNLVPFQFESHAVRVITNDAGEPLFVAKDVAVALGYANTSDAIKAHCKGVAQSYPLQTAGGIQEVRVIREPDLYRLIFKSTLPSAQEFERLVVEEILPAIRKTGTYAKEPQATLVLRTATDMVALAHLFGFTGNQALLSADRATNTLTGVSPMQLLGSAHLVSKLQERLLTVTELGKLLGLSAVATNKLLTSSGLQTAQRNAKGDLVYTPTEAGSRYGVFLDTNKKHGDGTPVQQIKWYASTAKQLQEPKD